MARRRAERGAPAWGRVALSACATFAAVFTLVVLASGGRGGRGRHTHALHALGGGAALPTAAAAAAAGASGGGSLAGAGAGSDAGSRSRSGLRCAIVALIRGEKQLEGYAGLRARNRALHEHFNRRYGYDNLHFHEGDVLEEHMRVLAQETPHTRFVDVRQFGAFKLPSWVRTPLRRQPDDKPLGYKHMCRFFTLQLWEALAGYDYVMRFDDDVILETDIVEDPFEFMYERDIVYTYSAEVDEWHQLTNRTFYEWARAYVEDKGIATQHDRITQTMFFTHFFITDVTFWRQVPVQQMLHAVDETGNIYYYRWGDAPIHTVVLKTFLTPSSLYKMHGLEYCHYSTGHCLRDGVIKEVNREAKADLQGLVSGYIENVVMRLAVMLLPHGWGAPEVLKGKTTGDMRGLLIFHLGGCTGEGIDHLAEFSNLELLTWAAECWKWDLSRDLPQLKAIKEAPTHEDVRKIVDKEMAALYGLPEAKVNGWTDMQLYLYMFTTLPMMDENRNGVIDTVNALTDIPVRIVQMLSDRDLYEVCRVQWSLTEGSNAALRELVVRHVRSTAAFSDSGVAKTILNAHIPMLAEQLTDEQLHHGVEMLLEGETDKAVFKFLHQDLLEKSVGENGVRGLLAEG